MANPSLRIGIDVGGTFTDFLCVRTLAGGEVALSVHKIPSTPEAPERAVLKGLNDLGIGGTVGGTAGGAAPQIIHGSTVATNALLERKGARTAFVANRGFGDLLTLARQTRPRLYALEFEPVPPPVPAELCLETGGRVAADGATIDPLGDKDLAELVGRVRESGAQSVAVNLLFSFLDPSHEEAIEAALRAALPGVFVSRSSRVLPECKEYERGIATWLNASLGPLVGGYLRRLGGGLAHLPSGGSLQVMQSSGETISAEQAADSAVRLLLSGPAGGLAAVEYLGRQLGERRLISFDMGGTSTDVALLDGPISVTSEGRLGDFPISVPMVDMHTIGAGGGSIAFVDSGGMLQVGPESAGADPGPACYGKGGTRATVTDANLLLGRLPADSPLAGGLALDWERAQAAVGHLAEKVGLDVEATARGIVSIANEHMVEAIRRISVNRGYDPKDFLLVSFGGAGGLHVCALADALGMRRAVVPVYAGVLSALGMAVADRGRQFSRSLRRSRAVDPTAMLEREFARLLRLARDEYAGEGLDSASMRTRFSIDLRYTGQSSALNIPWTDWNDSQAQFHDSHRRRYGYALEKPVEAVNVRLRAWFPQRGFDLPKVRGAGQSTGNAGGIPPSSGPQADAAACLAAGATITGPATLPEYASTTHIAHSWQARRDGSGNLFLERRD